MKAIIGLILTVLYIIMWGCLLCIGFWAGRKITDRLDLWLTRKTTKKCVEELEQKGIF